MTLGSPRLHLRVTDSTNERAKALAAAGAPHGLLVTASEQSVCDDHAHGPVDEEGPEAPAERGHGPRAFLGQTEALAPVTEVGAHLLGCRAWPREPRSDCLPVVHPTTVLRAIFDTYRWVTRPTSG